MKNLYGRLLSHGILICQAAGWSFTHEEKEPRIMLENSELVEAPEGLRTFALRLTSDVTKGEELLRSTLLRALEKKGRFDARSNLEERARHIMFNIFATQDVRWKPRN